MNNLQFDKLKTPVYVIDEKKLIHNLTILKDVEERTGCHILLAQKAFSAKENLRKSPEVIRSGREI